LVEAHARAEVESIEQIEQIDEWARAEARAVMDD
jgi:hypothetical protein